MQWAKYRFVLALALVASVFWLGWRFLHSSSVSPADSIRLLRLATARSPAEGWQTAQETLAAFPENLSVASAVADSAVAAGEYQQMLAIVSERVGLIAGDLTIESLIARGRHRIAMSLLDVRISGNGADAKALLTRGELFLRHGRLLRARSDFQRLLESGSIPLDSLVFLSSRRELLEDVDGLKLALKVDPSYAPIYLGLGVFASFKGRLAEAEAYLTRALELDERIADSWAALGLVYYKTGDVNERLVQWQQQVIDKNIRHADVEFLLAWLAEQAGDEQRAVSILIEALREWPLHRASCHLLSTVLARQAKGRAAAEFFARRAELIHDLEIHMHEVLFGNRVAPAFRKAAELFGQLGAGELASAWANGLGPLPKSDFDDSISEQSIAVDHKLQELLMQCRHDLPFYGRKPASVESPNERLPVKSTFESVFTFTDVSSDVGLPSAYYGGFENFESGLRVYQGFGGGVAVLDFDHDDKPDLFFTQASEWGASDKLPFERQDQLYRSQTGRYQLANEFALESEHDFGQGVASGDVNRDGFDDIYIANIGANKLLVNNGDGTFEHIRMDSKGDADWTTSCLLADLDNDGLDDIYDVQYLSGSEPFEKICLSGPEQLVRSCLPSLFEAASDRFLRNLGDDSFDDQSESSGLEALKGRGLGIVATDLDGVPGLEVFVSNDMTANHYLQIDFVDDSLLFKSQAQLQGLASNGEGQLEACMGIAAADVSGDGLVDLFVTNFFEETNTYYEALNGGFFRDQTLVAKLGAVSRKKLGFGTQAMDIDLDGDLDMLIANGHVDDYTHMMAPWKMTADFMENGGNGRFRKLPESGAYGTTPTLGRSVARLDWNRDGLPDAVITHLDRGPALLTNSTQPNGNFVSIKLVGTQSNRPAIGTTVVARFDDSELTVQQNAGDGYYCSNERLIMLGVGDAKVVSDLEVRWPSGKSTKFENVPVGTRYVAVEGRRNMYTLIP